MQICVHSGRRFEETFENAHWRNLNKCNQWDYAPSRVDKFMVHLITKWNAHDMKIHMLCNVESTLSMLNLDFLNKCNLHTFLMQLSELYGISWFFIFLTLGYIFWLDGLREAFLVVSWDRTTFQGQSFWTPAWRAKLHTLQNLMQNSDVLGVIVLHFWQLGGLVARYQSLSCGVTRCTQRFAQFWTPARRAIS